MRWLFIKVLSRGLVVRRELVLIMPRGGPSFSLHYFPLTKGSRQTRVIDSTKKQVFVYHDPDVDCTPLCSVRMTSHLFREADPCTTLVTPWYIYLCDAVPQIALCPLNSLSWPNHLPSFICLKKPLQVPQGGKPIFIAPYGTLDSLCTATTSLSL